jgi:hypothetical protein
MQSLDKLIMKEIYNFKTDQINLNNEIPKQNKINKILKWCMG